MCVDAGSYVSVTVFQASLVAVAVPDPEVLPKWAENKLGVNGSLADLCCDPVSTLTSYSGVALVLRPVSVM